ncbi:M3 family metallopeptidase [Microvirga sp. SRT01]|uniref:M3 family metallopeptidase n=1 Tax=Sphingomonas longa TaxID=2778730 RepID=A0ABS2D6K2_9SPHN|nr:MULTISPECIES: M3 family metallopeptidase [Alphaproteobacteria]MBM6576523.1 M3 family metallopeptidase [Sphingomonas sp. BT552]MBR7709569.1 M3 family metallopeptidase [Microvirga sp. SRT01]
MPDPLLDESDLPFGAPAFDRIAPDAFLPALTIALAEAKAEIEAIATDPAEPDFANTVEAMERVGGTLARVRRIFWTLSSAQSTPSIRAVEAEVSAMLTRHGIAVSHDPRLFARVDALWSRRDALGLNEAQMRLLEGSRRGFVDGGALLAHADKARFAAIAERLSLLGTTFGQNVLAATHAWTLRLDTEDCAGLPDTMLAATARRAEATGQGGHVITLDRGDVEGFLSFADRRDLREQVWRAFTTRGDGGAYDNRAIIDEMLALRREKAALLGHASYSDFALADSMAKTPDAAEALLMRVWTPALRQAAAEQAELQMLAGDTPIAAWDWRYYAERIRRERHALDGAAVKRFLTQDAVRDAAFAAAGRLYGMEFAAIPSLPGWHPGVQPWSVSDAGGTPRGLLYTDFHVRPEKHGGAWMGALRVQEALDGPVLPIVYIVANFAPGAGLSIDEARTLFHEFGHALHALLSDVVYPSQSGTAVARDFVEFPSKFMEHWIVAPEVLVGLGVPAPLADAIASADRFGQGFATVEFLASAILDLSLHRRTDGSDAVAEGEALLAELGLPDTIVPRHGLTHFTHVFDGGYASQYYSYLWSEVLDADAYAAFEERGDLFAPDLAGRLRTEVLARGDTRDAMAAYVAFRGREPREAALLEARGLAA